MNNLTIALAVCVFFVGQGSYCQVQTPGQQENLVQVDKQEWRAGNYRGLKVGKSTSVDMRRVLGKPGWTGAPYSKHEIWYEYPNAGEFQSKIVIIISTRTKTILSIDLYPENLSKSKAIEHFGVDYRVTKYAFDECLGDEESGRMYESPSGPLTFIEYRNRGIAIGLAADENVNEISFVKGPLSSTKPKCAGENPKRD